MNVSLSIASTDLDNEEIQTLTRNLCETINEMTDSHAVLGEEAAGLGAKGDVVTIGTIILSLIGSGGVAVSLVNILRAYVDRERSFRVRIKGKGGAEVEIDANNLTPDQIKQTTSMVRKVLGVS